MVATKSAGCWQTNFDELFMGINLPVGKANGKG
jgi:hypothetical protein